MELGTRAVRLGEAARIADVLGLDLSDLVFGTLDPAAELTELRNAADSHMRMTRRAAVNMSSAFLEVVGFLEDNPALLGSLEVERGVSAPANADEYLDWVRKRMDYAFRVPENPNRIYVEDDKRRGQLTSLLEAVVATVVTDVPIEPVQVVSRHPAFGTPGLNDRDDDAEA